MPEPEAICLRLAMLGKQAEVVVEGVVLHHQDDDVVERQ